MKTALHRENERIDYYPFGSVMYDRNFNSPNYRYGFNGKEKDDEVSGGGNSYNFGERTYDPRLGRFKSLDPLFTKYPFVSNYSYALNNPIFFIDNVGADVHPSFAMRLFHPKQYKAVLAVLKTEEGKKLFQDYATAKEAKKYWGISQAGKNAENTDVIFGAKANAATDTKPSIKIDGKNVHPQNVDEGNISKIHGDSKARIYINLTSKGALTGSTGEYVADAAHEAGVHAKYLLQVLNYLRDDKVSAEDKVKYIDAAKQLWGVLDQDYHHALMTLGKASSYNNIIQQVKSAHPDLAKDIQASHENDQTVHDYAGKVLTDEVKAGRQDKSKLEEPKK